MGGRFVSNRNHTPDITIGFCVRNSERTVKNSLQSILNQDYPKKNTKIVIVDGNSTDRTMEIARKMLRESEVESEFCSDEGKGLGTARQIVLDHSQGKYVVVSPVFVRNQVKFMEDNSEIGVATGRYVFWKNARSALPGLLQSLSKYMGSVTYKPTKEYHGLPPNDASIYRTNASKNVGGYDTAIRGAGEDEDIILRIINAGWQVSVNKEATYSAFSRQSLKSLWGEQVWFGKGKHFIRHKHKLHTLMPIPPVFFIVGLRDGQAAYRLTGRKESFLLSTYYVFGTVAWWFGFINAHCSGYGHSRALYNH
jgi:cellulose synthase/poly-beta-1,6-N-acetylglucosamine synthase-like glycosyltransferase